MYASNIESLAVRLELSSRFNGDCDIIMKIKSPSGKLICGTDYEGNIKRTVNTDARRPVGKTFYFADEHFTRETGTYEFDVYYEDNNGYEQQIYKTTFEIRAEPYVKCKIINSAQHTYEFYLDNEKSSVAELNSGKWLELKLEPNVSHTIRAYQQNGFSFIQNKGEVMLSPMKEGQSIILNGNRTGSGTYGFSIEYQ